MNAQHTSAENFERLMEEGSVALKSGDRSLAHDLWREAALLDPYNERVWLALLDVLERLEDRRVCLRNIVEINPMNVQARRMLRAYEARSQRRIQLSQQQKHNQVVKRRRRHTLIRRALLLGFIFGLSGVCFAIVLSILLYAI